MSIKKISERMTLRDFWNIHNFRRFVHFTFRYFSTQNPQYFETYMQVFRRSATGVVTFTCGSTTHCTRNWWSRTWIKRARFSFLLFSRCFLTFFLIFNFYLQIYKACLEMLPHKQFTFAKVWIMFAQFEIRQLNLQAARKILVKLVCSKNRPQKSLNAY